MRGNDLSNEIPLRLAFMWEGCLVKRPKVRKFERPSRVIKKAEINPEAFKVVFDLVWRYDYGVDLITLLGDTYKDPLEKWVWDKGLPLRNILAFNSVDEARDYIISNPFMSRVFVGSDSSPFMLGGATYVIPPTGAWGPLL